MKKALVIPSVRPAMMKKFLCSLDFLQGWDVLACIMGYDQAGKDLIQKSHNYSRITFIQEYDERKPPYPIRVQILDTFRDEYDVFCSVDDDMEFLSTVDYEPMVKACMHPYIGVISGNWVKHEAYLKRIKPVKKFITQPVVYTGGGLMFDGKIVDILTKEKRMPYLFDDLQISLLAYTNGFENMRYRGSLIIHRILQKDGLRASHHLWDFTLPDPELITVREAEKKKYEKDNNYYMPLTKDLTRKANLMHEIQKVGVRINASV